MLESGGEESGIFHLYGDGEDAAAVGRYLRVCDADAWEHSGQLYQELTVVSQIEPDPQQMQDLVFAWQVAKYVKSNAIIYARNLMTIGVGAGQMSRINSARIRGIKAEQANF